MEKQGDSTNPFQIRNCGQNDVITVIYKEGRRDDSDNYKVVKNNLSHIPQKQIDLRIQVGFRVGRSTVFEHTHSWRDLN